MQEYGIMSDRIQTLKYQGIIVMGRVIDVQLLTLKKDLKFPVQRSETTGARKGPVRMSVVS